MAAELETGQGRAAYRKRKWVAEPPNGWIENKLGFRQFGLRGLHRVRSESKLVCSALNLRRRATMTRQKAARSSKSIGPRPLADRSRVELRKHLGKPSPKTHCTRPNHSPRVIATTHRAGFCPADA